MDITPEQVHRTPDIPQCPADEPENPPLILGGVALPEVVALKEEEVEMEQQDKLNHEAIED